MLMALLPWFSLMAAGLVASVLLLLWGHKSGQFADQERARYLPLVGEEVHGSNREQRRITREIYVLAILMAGAVVAFAAALGVAVLR